MARYKWPDRLEISAKLPHTLTGKVIKNVLRKEIAEKLGAERARKGGKEEEEEEA